MLARQNNQTRIRRAFFYFSGLFLLLLCGLSISIQGQIDPKKNAPFFHDYKGIKIGMKADEVRAKLGKAKSDDKDGLFYAVSDLETLQIILDAEQKVRTISIMFDGENQTPLKFEDVFGKTVAPEKQAGGSIYKLISYPDSGYWVSYNRMAGEKPMTVVVMQKMP